MEKCYLDLSSLIKWLITKASLTQTWQSINDSVNTQYVVQEGNKEN